MAMTEYWAFQPLLRGDLEGTVSSVIIVSIVLIVFVVAFSDDALPFCSLSVHPEAKLSGRARHIKAAAPFSEKTPNILPPEEVLPASDRRRHEINNLNLFLHRNFHHK
jgi:hypothetical protein